MRLRSVGLQSVTWASAECDVCVVFQRPVNEEKSPVGPWLLALFVFVVCGSGELLLPQLLSPVTAVCVMSS